MSPQPAEIERVIAELVDARAPGRTICPSDAARALGGDTGYRALMQPVRDAARDMVARGELEVTQRGDVVDQDTVRGAIRLRRPTS